MSYANILWLGFCEDKLIKCKYTVKNKLLITSSVESYMYQYNICIDIIIICNKYDHEFMKTN